MTFPIPSDPTSMVVDAFSPVLILKLFGMSVSIQFLKHAELFLVFTYSP
jgi:hypothetical protein